MMQFVRLLNAMSDEGPATFAEFLNQASSGDASRAGRWLSGASDAQIEKAAALLNAGDVDGFRDLIGCGGFWSRLFGRKKKAPKKVAPPAPPPEEIDEPDEPDEPDEQPAPPPARRENLFEEIVAGLAVASVGVRFDIDKIDSGAYGSTCWKVFWSEVEPAELAGAFLFEGDTPGTLSGRENVFCIAVQGSNRNLARTLRTALEGSEAFRHIAANPPFIEGSQATECLCGAGQVSRDGSIVGRDAFNSRAALGSARLKRRGVFQLPASVSARRRHKPASPRTANLPAAGTFNDLVSYPNGVLEQHLKGTLTPGELCDVVERYADLLKVQVNEYSAAISECIAEISLSAKDGSGSRSYIGMYGHGTEEEVMQECRSRLGDVGAAELAKFAREQGYVGRWQMGFVSHGSGGGGSEIRPELLWTWLRGRGELIGYPFPVEEAPPAAPAAPADDRIRFLCGGCKKVLRSPPQHVGRAGKCPKCGRDFVVPRQTTA